MAIGRTDLGKRIRAGFQMAGYDDLPALVRAAHIHGPRVPVNATVTLVRRGVEAPEVSASVAGVSPTPAVPRWYAEEGASIRINRVQPTPYSVRCAPASGRG